MTIFVKVRVCPYFEEIFVLKFGAFFFSFLFCLNHVLLVDLVNGFEKVWIN